MAGDSGNAIPASEAREKFSDLINRAAYGHERIIVTRRGKPVAAIVPAEDVALLVGAEDGGRCRQAQRLAAERRREEDVVGDPVHQVSRADAGGERHPVPHRLPVAGEIGLWGVVRPAFAVEAHAGDHAVVDQEGAAIPGPC